MKLLNFFRRKKRSGQYIAAQRLRLVLIHDRANISPGMLEVLKDEMIAVISKHLDIDADNVIVNLTEDNRRTRLVADIPIFTNRTRKTDAGGEKGTPDTS